MEIKAIILDWAGTSVDYGSKAPLEAFKNVFKEFGIDVSDEIIRKYMGLHKKFHTESILNEPSVSQLWATIHGRIPNQTDVDLIFSKLGHSMNRAVQEFSDPIDGVIDFMEFMQKDGVKFGSTTGYVREMMNILIPVTESKGLVFDSVVTPDEVPLGRPYPFMIYKNAINLATYPLWKMVKIGDTIADIEEGLNAGMWVIGITKTGNEMGLSKEELINTDPKLIEEKEAMITEKFMNAGAHYIASSLADCFEIIEDINHRIKINDMPN